MRQVVANLQAVIEYKEEELRIYRKKYKEDTGKERPDLTDDERRGLARKGKALNKLLLSLVGGSWSPQTVLGWYKTLIAEKYDSVAPDRRNVEGSVFRNIIPPSDLKLNLVISFKKVF